MDDRQRMQSFELHVFENRYGEPAVRVTINGKVFGPFHQVDRLVYRLVKTLLVLSPMSGLEAELSRMPEDTDA